MSAWGQHQKGRQGVVQAQKTGTLAQLQPQCDKFRASKPLSILALGCSKPNIAAGSSPAFCLHQDHPRSTSATQPLDTVAVPRNLPFHVHKALCLPRNLHTCHGVRASRFTTSCTCHDIRNSMFTKCVACREVRTSRITKPCTCLKIRTSAFSARLRKVRKVLHLPKNVRTLRFKKCGTCHEVCTSKVLRLPRDLHFKL